MKLPIFLLFILIASSFVCFSQAKQKSGRIYYLTEIGYGNGVGNIRLETLNSKIPYEGHFFRFRTQIGYFITEQLSVGIGFGLDGYHEFTANTAPVFVDARYFFSSNPQAWYAGLNFGHAISFSNNFENGNMYSLSAGKKISTRKLIFLPSVGFNVQQLNDFPFFGIDPSTSQAVFFNETVGLKSITINVGVLF